MRCLQATLPTAPPDQLAIQVLQALRELTVWQDLREQAAELQDRQVLQVLKV